MNWGGCLVTVEVEHIAEVGGKVAEALHLDERSKGRFLG